MREVCMQIAFLPLIILNLYPHLKRKESLITFLHIIIGLLFMTSIKNIYYRIIEHPWINYNPNERPWKKPLSIIIYDSNFQFLGETKLAEEYNLSANNFIITKEGLLIRKETNNEDEIKYTVFKLKEK